MAGISDVGQQLCMALALWNGRDPILKERMFGLTGPEGNHGEDVKEYWWYHRRTPEPRMAAVALPLPAGRVPLRRPRGRERPAGSPASPSTSCMDTGVFDDDRYWVVEVVHAKADPNDLLMEISVTNAGPDASTLHVLPHLWFRNTWAWDVGAARPALRAAGPDRVAVDHPRFGELVWEVDAGPGRRGCPTCCSARTRPTCAGLYDSARLARRSRRTASTTTSLTGAPDGEP